MRTIKAFYKGRKGYYCQPDKEKFYFEAGKTYKIDGEVELCKNGFHASANFDISETCCYYGVSEYTHYGIVEINVIENDSTKCVGNEITVIEFLPQDFDVLAKFDKTGRWIYEGGGYWKEFNFQKGLEILEEADKTGQWTYLAGLNWKEFDLQKGLKTLEKVDKTGKWTYLAGREWKEFDFEKGFEILGKADKTGEWIYWAGRVWKEFDYKKGLEILKKKNKSGELVCWAGNDWKI